MFWHVVDSGLDERLKNSHLALENLSKRDGDPEDFELIQQSILHVSVPRNMHMCYFLGN